MKIYTHDEATRIVDIFDECLFNYGIKVPSPEDDDRDTDNEAALYGTTYGDVLRAVEDRLIDILGRHTADTEIVTDVYSGTV